MGVVNAPDPRRMEMLWLRGACILTACVGAAACAASAAESEFVWRLLYDVVKWPIDGDPATFGATARVLNAILGGLMMGWATLMLAIVNGPFRRGDYELAGPMLISVVVWFVVDSVGSVLADLPENIVLNASFLVVFAVPLLRLRRSHHDAQS